MYNMLSHMTDCFIGNGGFRRKGHGFPTYTKWARKLSNTDLFPTS